MNRSELYMRTIIFGSPTASSRPSGSSQYRCAGIAQTVIFTGLIYAFVEAFFNGGGNYLSESRRGVPRKKVVSDRLPLTAGVIMFVSFVIAAFIPLAPYLYLMIRMRCLSQ